MTKRHATLRSLSPFVLALLASGCASTKVVDSWADPQAGKLKFKKVLAIVVTKDGSLRRTAEDEICKNMRKVDCTRGYALLPGEEALDKEKAKAKIKEGGFDGVVVMRALPVGDSGITRAAGAERPQYYYSMWTYYDYWGVSWGVPYTVVDTSYTKTVTYISLDTNVYRMSDEKLVWAGSTQTKNPDSARQVVKDVAEAVGRDLRAKGLLD